MGFEQEFEIERIWLLEIVDVWSRAVLGYHVSLNREYSRYDVIRTIENALAPHRPRQFTLPGVGYDAAGGFPSDKLSRLGYAAWQRVKLDKAQANLAGDVQYALAEFIGCFIDAGPAHSPDDRPYIERYFGTVASNLSSRLPGCPATPAPTPATSAERWPTPRAICACTFRSTSSKTCLRPRWPSTTPARTTA